MDKEREDLTLRFFFVAPAPSFPSVREPAVRVEPCSRLTPLSLGPSRSETTPS